MTGPETPHGKIVNPLTSLFGEDADVLREPGFQVLLAVAILPPLGSGMLSPVLDSLIGPFGTSPANIGLVVSFFTAPAIVVIPIAGMLADRMGRKPVIVTAILLYGAAGTAIAFTTDFRVVLGLRLLQGVGFGGITPIVTTLLGDRYTASREETSQGLRSAATGLTGAVAPLLSGVLVVIAWQFPFLLYAIAFPIALLVARHLEEPSVETAATARGEFRSYAADLARLARRRRPFFVVLGRALPNFVWIGFITYNSLIVVRLMDGTPPQAGLLKAAGSVLLASGASQAGRITARLDGPFLPLALANVLMVAGFGVVLFAPDLIVAALGIAVVGAGFGTALSLYRSVITAIPPARLRSGLVSLSEAASRLTATLTPILMGAIIALATPSIGFAGAIRLAGGIAALVGGGGGLLCLLIAFTGPAPSGRANRTAGG